MLGWVTVKLETLPVLPALPVGVEHIGGREPLVTDVELGERTWTIVFTEYRAKDLRIRIGWDVGHPRGISRNPSMLDVQLEAMHRGGEPFLNRGGRGETVDGITTAVLRSVPMAHARAFLRPTYEELALREVEGLAKELPGRVESVGDYLLISLVYLALSEGRTDQPVRQLAAWTGESVETWSARIRRARARGYIVGKGRNSTLSPAFRNLRNQLVHGAGTPPQIQRFLQEGLM